MALHQFATARIERLPPDETKAADIFSRLGYQFTDAVADLIDNSVDANSHHVHIRFVRSSYGIHSVIIADDGVGMSETELQEAMRFGSRSAKSGKQLGKYGIGLKSASLSQAETVTVLTRQRATAIGRRWTLENVKLDWSCDILEPRDVRKVFESTFGEFTISQSGTVVIWERLEHLTALPSNLDQVLRRTIKELSVELGLRFHKFLERGDLTISVDQQYGMEEPTEVPTYIEPLDPFGYDKSGHLSYPVTLKLTLGASRVDAVCHIWPPKSASRGYRLGGGKVALRQGFYFYRNERIIQAGGWNRLRGDDGEPHLSLARVEVHLPSTLDSMFKLDVTKSTLDPSPQFIGALQGAATDGVTFEKYLAAAEGSYRRQKKKDNAKFPVIPGTGLSVKAQRAIAGILHESGTTRPDRVSFKWSRLDADEVVRVSLESSVIMLNSRYRSALVEGDSNDAPVLKVALMFLLQDELLKAFSTQKSIDWMQRINLALLASMKE